METAAYMPYARMQGCSSNQYLGASHNSPAHLKPFRVAGIRDGAPGMAEETVEQK